MHSALVERDILLTGEERDERRERRRRQVEGSGWVHPCVCYSLIKLCSALRREMDMEGILQPCERLLVP